MVGCEEYEDQMEIVRADWGLLGWLVRIGAR